MSKFVDEIIQDICKNPEAWKPCKSYRHDDEIGGLEKAEIKIVHARAPLLLSVIDVKVHGLSQPMTYLDKVLLQFAVNRWFRSASLDQIKKIV